MSFNCTNCRKCNQQLLTLVCDHELCLQCAQNIKIPEGKPPLDAKFKIVCPRCSKATLTRDIHNLMNQESEKLLFQNIQSSELNQSSLAQHINNDPKKPGWSERQLREMSYSQRFSNIWAERKTPDIADRVSKASNDSKKNVTTRRPGLQPTLMTKCPTHQQPIAFLCENQLKVMCMECMYKHTKQLKSHKVCAIKDALGLIINENRNFKVEAKKKIEQLDKYMTVCKMNQGKMQQAFEINQQIIDKQFRELQQVLKHKEQQLLQHLEEVFQKKEFEVNSQLSDLNYLKNILKEHFQFSLQNQNNHVYFFNAYTIVRQAISKASPNIKNMEKEDLVCFDKFASLNEFKVFLDKFIKPRSGKDSRAPSRGHSQIGEKLNQKSKSILYQEYKNARKKLQKIDKIEKDHRPQREKDKTTHYLNNFVIEINKKENQIQEKPLQIKERKSSTSGYYSHEDKKVAKALTPTRIITSKPKKK